MSHIHNIGGNLYSAAELQAQLEQMRAARLARQAKESGIRPARTFDSEIEAYYARDGDGNERPREEDDGAREGADDSGTEPSPDDRPGVRYG
jgi:hypothetical protein